MWKDIFLKEARRGSGKKNPPSLLWLQRTDQRRNTTRIGANSKEKPGDQRRCILVHAASSLHNKLRPSLEPAARPWIIATTLTASISEMSMYINNNNQFPLPKLLLASLTVSNKFSLDSVFMYSIGWKIEILYF